MKTLPPIVATLALTTAAAWAVGSMGALFRGCWQAIALEKALVSECTGKESGSCYTAREVVAEDLQTLIEFCKSLSGSSAAETALKQAEHDLDVVKRAKPPYKFDLTMQGGAQWSSGDAISRPNGDSR